VKNNTNCRVLSCLLTPSLPHHQANNQNQGWHSPLLSTDRGFGQGIAAHVRPVAVKQLRWMQIGAAASCTGEAAAGNKHEFWHDSAEKLFIKVEVAQKGDRDSMVVCGWWTAWPSWYTKYLYFYVFLVVHTHPLSNNFMLGWLASF